MRAQSEGDGRTLRIALTGAIEGDDLCLGVTDDGAGIAESPTGKWRCRASAAIDDACSRQCCGLGLSLVAAVAHLHGGRVTLGDAGSGLKVSLHLPIQRASRAPV